MIKNAYVEERLDQITVLKLARKRGNKPSSKKKTGFKDVRKTVCKTVWKTVLEIRL
jgi:hypothetical protein